MNNIEATQDQPIGFLLWDEFVDKNIETSLLTNLSL